jgi:hypothetical protein
MVYLTQVTGVLITLTQDVLRKEILVQQQPHNNNNNNNINNYSMKIS